MKKYIIEVAVDTEEGIRFVAWLCDQGHTAYIGRTTGNIIDGVWTSHNENANEIMRDLWDAYCAH